MHNTKIVQSCIGNIIQFCCHSLRGSVDWNWTLSFISSRVFDSHSLRGSVDWNIISSPVPLGDFLVTPCVGVWIEIFTSSGMVVASFVTPCVGVWIEIMSSCSFASPPSVTPCVGVWIEMTLSGAKVKVAKCHSLRGSVDWNDSSAFMEYSKICHSLRGSVDWNQDEEKGLARIKGHSLRGSVDWNTLW